MEIDILHIVLILILLATPIFCVIVEISSILMDIRGLLREITTRPEMFPTKVTKGYDQLDSNVFYIHYNKEELEKFRK